MQNTNKERRNLRRKIKVLQKSAIERGLNGVLLQEYNFVCNYKHEAANKRTNKKLIVAIVTSFIVVVISLYFVNSVLSARCLLPSNYLVWEATRPLANCAYCVNVTKPIILRNISRRDFVVRWIDTIIYF